MKIHGGKHIDKLSKKIASEIGAIILKELGPVYKKRGLPFSQVGLPYHPGQLYSSTYCDENLLCPLHMNISEGGRTFAVRTVKDWNNLP